MQALGRRHVQYGVQHYQTVGAALLWALEQELGSLDPGGAGSVDNGLYRPRGAHDRGGRRAFKTSPATPQGLSPGFTKNDEGAHIPPVGNEADLVWETSA